MSNQVIQPSENRERSEQFSGTTDSRFLGDVAMARIWIELFTRAALYAGAIGLIVGMAAVFFFND